MTSPTDYFKNLTGYIVDKVNDPPRGAVTNAEVIGFKLSKPSREPEAHILLKGFSFYNNPNPSHTNLLQRANGDYSLQFHLLGGIGQLIKGKGLSETSNVYHIAYNLNKITELDWIICLTMSLALANTTFRMNPSSYDKSDSGNMIEIKREPDILKLHDTSYKNDNNQEERVKFDPNYIDNLYMNHFLQVDCRDSDIFEEFYNRIVIEQTFNDNWLLKFLILMLVKNKLVCVAQQAIKNFDIYTLKTTIHEYYETVQELNQKYIYNYNVKQGYFYYWFFYHNLKIPSNVNTLREWYNFMFSDESLKKAEISITQGYTTLSYTDDKPLHIKSNLGYITSSQQRSFYSDSTIFHVKKHFMNYRHIPITALSTFGLGKLINMWFMNKKEKVIKLHPQREQLINTVSNAFQFNPSIKNMRYLWELLSVDIIEEKRLSKILKHYKTYKPSYVFLPNSLDYSLSTTLYTHLIVKLFTYIRYYYYRFQYDIQGKIKDGADYADDSARDFIQYGKQSAAALAVMIVTGGSAGVSLLQKTVSWGISNIGNVIEKMNEVKDTSVPGGIKSLNDFLIEHIFSIIVSSLQGIIFITPIVVGLLSPFFLIPIFAKLFAMIRVGCSKLYKMMINDSSITLLNVNDVEIQKGTKLFEDNLKKEVKQQIEKIKKKQTISTTNPTTPTSSPKKLKNNKTHAKYKNS